MPTAALLRSHENHDILQWITVQWNLHGNEQASILAKVDIMLVYNTKREKSFLTSKLFIKQIMEPTYANELLSKIETKCGKNICNLDISDNPRWEAVTAFRGRLP